MFARAVVLQGTGGANGYGALQQVCTQPRLPQDMEGGTGMGDGPTVGGTGNGQLPLLELVPLCCAGENQQAGLEGLEGRAAKAGPEGIPRTHEQSSLLIRHGGMDPMHRFHNPVAAQQHVQGRGGGASASHGERGR